MLPLLLRVASNGHPAVRMRTTETAVGGYQLPIDEGTVVAGQEGRHRGDLFRLSRSLQWRNGADFVLNAACARLVKSGARHVRLNQPRQYDIDPNVGSGEHVGRTLRN